MADVQHAATPPGPLVVRGGFAARAVDFAGSVAAFVSGAAAVESLRLLAAGRFTAAAGSAAVAVAAWQGVKRIDRVLIDRAARR